MSEIEKIKGAARLLREAFIEVPTITLNAYDDGRIVVQFHGCANHSHATELLRELGIGERTKQVHEPERPWHVLMGDANGIHADAFVQGLPPSCAIVETTEEVPETIATGKMIARQVRQIVCGGVA